ncbi:DUF3558 domain-containing protein [Streptomyces sp. B6B3]|uniref:DUF3558 domain-containing protein n=1 Tax=Streptomyces sp. B6B3 TaxID=3153570 RepID=UPI00325C6762
MSRTVRTAPRVVARSLAWAALPVLLVAGCTGSPPEDDNADDQQAESAAPTPEPVRFSTLPDPCSTVGGDTIEEVVPKAEPKSGETLSSNDTSASGACLWSGLDDYQFRSLTVSLRRFDSDPAIGSGDERAAGYLADVVGEIGADDANTEVAEAQLADLGDEATSIGFEVVKESDGDDQRYRQQRAVSRVGNIVVTVDYSGAGFEGADMPSADRVRENAETALSAAVAAVEASEGAAQDDGQDDGQGGEQDGEQGGEPGQDQENKDQAGGQGGSGDA